jgi:uncharacterized protein YeaO (DUF488 family)
MRDLGSKKGSKLFHIKRIYEPAAKTDGYRIFVERLWPRGVSKAEAALHDWLKDIAPSTDLRKWYGHDLARWEEFKERYRAELKEKQHLVEQMRMLHASGPVTLVFAAKDEEHSSAAILKDVLERD